MSDMSRVAIIGAGPAGLMAAESLSRQRIGVDIYDAMPSFGRKFLMAGKSGLNITHAEKKEIFLKRYPNADPRLTEMVSNFDADDLIHWMAGLGIKVHTGSTGRVFPQMMKASPLLRSWLGRLQGHGAQFFPRHSWQGWDEEGALCFETPDGARSITPAATVLALGGASWSRLGSDGAWATHLAKQNIQLAPFLPSNCGFTVDWSDHMAAKFAGEPIKSVRLSSGPHHNRGEFVITSKGVESGGIYTLSAALREQLIKRGRATLMIDLVPDMSEAALVKRLSHPQGKQSFSNHLRKTVRISGAKAALLRECAPSKAFENPALLAKALKALPLKITGTAPLDEAISTTGGIAWEALDDQLMLKALPGVFCAGEMIDWDAPTGGYLHHRLHGDGPRSGRGRYQLDQSSGIADSSGGTWLL